MPGQAGKTVYRTEGNSIVSLTGQDASAGSPRGKAAQAAAVVSVGVVAKYHLQETSSEMSLTKSPSQTASRQSKARETETGKSKTFYDASVVQIH